MAIRSGFFNSVNGDRKYSASDFAEYFASFISSGVFPNPSTNLQVIANNNMTVTVRAGKAWINGYILINDDDYILEIEPADGVLNRIDRIVARYDVSNREITLEVKRGEFASNAIAKELQRDADVYEIALADIQVNAGVISISQSAITDLRLNSELCGIVHGTVEQVDTTTLFNQYVDWYTTTTGQAETDIEAIKQQFQDNLTQFEQDWNDWFSQQQTEGFVMAVEKGQPNGIATLDENGKVPDEQLPEIEVPSPTIATQAEAETGTNNTKMMTPLRTQQAFDSKIQMSGDRVKINIAGEWVTFKREFDLTSWSEIQQIVRMGLASEYFRVGDQLVSAYDGGEITWEVIGIDVDTPADSNYTHSMTLQTKDCLHNIQFDAKEPNNPNSDRKSYGNNRYIHSAVRQWLNSNESKFNWKSQHQYDAEPTNSLDLYNGAGFLYRLDPELVSVIGLVNKRVARNTDADGGGQDTFSDKVFLLSQKEVGLGEEGDVAGEFVYPFYDGIADAGRIKQLNGSNSAWWLRSPTVSSSYYVRRVHTAGSLNDFDAHFAYGVSPACVII